MNTLNKAQLLNDFLNKNDIISEILSANRKVFYYIIKDDKTWKTGIELMKDLITDFIKETFYFDEDVKTKEELLKLVEEYDLTEYIDWLIDIYDEDLVNSYSYFQEFVEEWEDPDILDKLKNAQYYWYSKLFEDIQNDFRIFLI